MQFARMAIMNLEQIREDDVERREAFALVEQWIKDHPVRALNGYKAEGKAYCEKCIKTLKDTEGISLLKVEDKEFLPNHACSVCNENISASLL